jgi:hypothetical protein
MFNSKCYTEEWSIFKKVLIKFEAGGQKGEVNTELQATGGVQFRAQPGTFIEILDTLLLHVNK